MKRMRAFAVTAVVAFGPANAVASDAWESFLVQMGSYESITATADQFAMLMGQEDGRGLSALAEKVVQSLDTDHLALIEKGFDLSVLPGEGDAEYLERLSENVTRLGVFGDASATRAAMDSLGACQTAGILLRNLILAVADGGAKPNLVEGHLVVDDTGNDWRYAEAFARCQIVGRHALGPSAVGYSQKACQATLQPYCPEIVDQ